MIWPWALILVRLNVCPPDHSEQIARIIRVGNHVKIDAKAGAVQLIAYVAQRRKILFAGPIVLTILIMPSTLTKGTMASFNG